MDTVGHTTEKIYMYVYVYMGRCSVEKCDEKKQSNILAGL